QLPSTTLQIHDFTAFSLSPSAISHPLLAFHLMTSQIHNFTAFSLSPSAICHQPSASLNDFTNPRLYGLSPSAISHLPSAFSLSPHGVTNQHPHGLHLIAISHHLGYIGTARGIHMSTNLPVIAIRDVPIA